MVKKIISYIFIYILLVGCESPLICEDCYLDINAPDLTLDDNGYYHMEFLDSYVQTFSTLEAETGITSYNQKVKWISNKEILIVGHWTNLVNSSSYTNGGVSHTVLGVWEQFIGDTIKVYCAFQDENGRQYTDSLGVIVDNEI